MLYNSVTIKQIKMWIFIKKKFLFYSCLILPGKHCSAVRKQWLPNTNYNNPTNWNKGRVPCDGDNVQLDRVRALIYTIII